MQPFEKLDKTIENFLLLREFSNCLCNSGILSTFKVRESRMIFFIKISFQHTRANKLEISFEVFNTSYLGREAKLLSFQDFSNVKVEEITIENSLDTSSNNCDEIKESF